MGTGAKLGRAAAHLWRQRQRLQATPVEPAAARLGHAAGAALGQRIHAAAPGRLNNALRHSGRRLWQYAGGALHRLGLQISAVLFLFFAAGFGFAGVKGWMASRAHAHLMTSLTQASPSTQWELALALLFAYFGISSLLRSRRHLVFRPGAGDAGEAGQPEARGAAPSKGGASRATSRRA